MDLRKAEKLDLKATYFQEKAEDFFNNKRYRKANKSFLKAAELFEQIAREMDESRAWALVIKNLVNAAKTAILDGNPRLASKLQRRLALIHLELNDKDAAMEYYRVSIKYALKENKVDVDLVLKNAMTYFFMIFLQGASNKALDFLKRIFGKVDIDIISNRESFSLLKRFTNSIRKPSNLEIDLNKDVLRQEGFSEEEIKIIEYAFGLKKIIDDSVFNFWLEKPQQVDKYREGEIITGYLEIKVSNDDVLSKISNKLDVETIIVEKSNDLTIVEEFHVPDSIKFDSSKTFFLKFKSYYPGDNEIGPLLLEMKINDFKAVKKVDGIKFSIFARPTNIIVSATEMSEPLIGKSFPLRIEVKNESKGNASDL
ncbi:MAG: tetratricopeptide repeat protein, partial [Promethearchaeota archaeon]